MKGQDVKTTGLTHKLTQNGRANAILLADRHYNLTVKVMQITRELALEWLKKNALNRAVRRGNLQRLINALKSGTWDHCNGETIVFADDGSLMDGQHRLQAVVETGIPITSLVVWGVEARKMGTIDTGSMRGMGDYFAMAGYKNGRNLAAALALLALWERGEKLTHHLMSLTVFASYEAGLEALKAHASLVENLKDARRMPNFMSLSELTVLGYLFAQRDRKVHGKWVDTMIHGTQHPEAPSFVTLRERLLREAASRTKRPEFEAFAYHIKAFNAARKRRPLRVFKLYTNEPFPTLD